MPLTTRLPTIDNSLWTEGRGFANILSFMLNSSRIHVLCKLSIDDGDVDIHSPQSALNLRKLQNDSKKLIGISPQHRVYEFWKGRRLSKRLSFLLSVILCRRHLTLKGVDVPLAQCGGALTIM